MSDGDRSDDTAIGRLKLGVYIIGGIVAGLCFLAILAGIYDRRDARGDLAEISYEKQEGGTDQNLKADVHAASAAEDMVDLTIFQFLAGVLGIYLVARTLAATRAAVSAANEATGTAREMGEAQARAYVLVSHLELDFNRTDDEIGKIKLRNSGATPAYRISYSASIFLKLGDKEFEGHAAENFCDLGGREAYELSFKARDLAERRADILDLLGKKHSGHIDMTIKFEDVFGKRLPARKSRLWVYEVLDKRDRRVRAGPAHNHEWDCD
ncbi:hypothetical protein BH10PSE1_BH10PSE1_06240 [soil metagenome]